MILLNAELDAWLKARHFPMEMKAVRAAKYIGWYKQKNVDVQRGTLLLQTACGKMIHIFQNVQIKTTLNKAEREFIMSQILIPWLIQHEQVIKDIVEFTEHTAYERAEAALTMAIAKFSPFKVHDCTTLHICDSDGTYMGRVRFDKKEVLEETNIDIIPATIDITDQYPEVIQEHINMLHKMKKMPWSEIKQKWFDIIETMQTQQEHVDHCYELLEGVCEL